MESSGKRASAHAPDQSRQIVGLDVIRGLAALLVLCFHLGFWIWRDHVPRLPVPAAYDGWTPLFSRGWVGVEIFFVLSGFVIAYSTEGATARRFLQHRVNRLLPAALLCSTATGTLLLTAYPLREVGAQWLRSVVFFPVGPWIDGSYWTLPIEVAFYALVGVTLLFRRGRFLPWVIGVLGAVSAVACLVVLLDPAWVPRALVTSLSASGFPPGACLLLIHGTFFALGVFLYLTCLQGITPPRLTLVALYGVGCVSELVWHDRGAALATGVLPEWPVPVGVWLASVLGLIASVRWNAAIREALGSRGLRLTRRVGIATYPLYLLHAKIGQVLIGGFHRRIGYGGAFLLTAVLLVMGALLVAEGLEPFLRRALQRLWHKAEARRLPISAVRTD